MNNRTRDLIDWTLSTPAVLQALTSESGLTSGYVASELRRFRKFLDNQPITGRLAISYRVARELIKLNQAMIARYSVEPSETDGVDNCQTDGFEVVEHALPSQGECVDDAPVHRNCINARGFYKHMWDKNSPVLKCLCEECKD